MSADTTPQANMFGNLSVPQRSGLPGLSLGLSIALVPVVLVVVLLTATQRIVAAVILVLLVATGLALKFVTKRQGRTIYGRLLLRMAQKQKEASNRHVYLAGPTGKGTPDGATRLPGLMARSELSEHRDSFGNPFAMIRVSGNGVHNYSVVFEAHPDGEALIDEQDMQRRVALWGNWLTQRGMDEGIRGASVTIETAPDSGLRLSRLLENNRVEGSPDFAGEVTRRIEESYHGGAPQVVARIAVTFSGKRVDGRQGDRGVDDMAEELGNRIPTIKDALGGTGAGAVTVCTAQQIIDFTRIAYDPTVASTVEEMQSEPGGTGLSWEDAGPSFALDAFDHYVHDRAFSKSWTMYEKPAGNFTADSLHRALAPVSGALRKRVTLLYRPIPIDQASDVVQQEQNNARYSRSVSNANARANVRLAVANKTAMEEAQGAGLTRFGLIVTVTTTEVDDFKRWDRQVPGLFTRARLRLRPALANQAVTFQAGLPLGLVSQDHMMIPEGLREMF